MKTLSLLPPRQSLSLSTIAKELEEVRSGIAASTARRDALNAERTKLQPVGSLNPSDSFRLSEIETELSAIEFDLKRGLRHERALAFDQNRLGLGPARSNADEKIERAKKAIGELESLVAASREQILKKASAVQREIDTANRANEIAERLAGEILVFPRCEFSQQSAAVIRSLFAHPGTGHEWERLLSRQTGIPLGDSVVYL